MGNYIEATNVADVAILNARLKTIEVNTLLGAKTMLTIDDVTLLTGLSKSHIYKLTCTRQIPHYKPSGKIVYFDKKEVEEWLRQNRVGTIEEAEQKAEAYGLKGGAR